MALKEKTTPLVYLTIREGKIAKKVGEAYHLFDSVEGYIRGISTRDHKYGTDLCVTLEDDQMYQLQIKMKGEEPTSKQTAYFIAFAHCCPAINPHQRVEFIPSLKIVDDKKRSALFLKQNNEVLKWAYKVGQEGVPAPEELKNKKGEVISVDWSEVEAYRVDKVNEFTKNLAPAVPNDIVTDHAVNPYVESPQDDDDLPF
jgi:hypothetical protein